MGTSTTRSTRSKGAAATGRRGSARAQAEDAYEEVTGSSDFTPTWDFEAQGDLIGTFIGTTQRDIKGEDRTFHQFLVDGEEVECWGAAILDSRLRDVEPNTDVKVVKTGDKIKTKRGHANEFRVFAKRSSVRR